MGPDWKYQQGQKDQIEIESDLVFDKDSEKIESYPIDVTFGIGRIPLNPGLKFTTEERQRVDHLLKLDQSIVISFNDLEHDVALKVLFL